MFLNFLNILKDMLFFTGSYSNNVFPEPLSSEEEEKCINKMLEGDIDARNKLIEHNLRLVAHIVKRFDVKDVDTDDLISIGTIGLIKGIDTYKNNKKTKITTYAARCIQNEILMYFRSQKKIGPTVSLNDAIGHDKEGNEINLIDVIEYEDDDVVVIRRTGKAFNAVVDNIDVAIKNEDGDITNIVELKSKIVKYI